MGERIRGLMVIAAFAAAVVAASRVGGCSAESAAEIQPEVRTPAASVSHDRVFNVNTLLRDDLRQVS